MFNFNKVYKNITEAWNVSHGNLLSVKGWQTPLEIWYHCDIVVGHKSIWGKKNFDLNFNQKVNADRQTHAEGIPIICLLLCRCELKILCKSNFTF